MEGRNMCCEKGVAVEVTIIIDNTNTDWHDKITVFGLLGNFLHYTLILESCSSMNTQLQWQQVLQSAVYGNHIVE